METQIQIVYYCAKNKYLQIIQKCIYIIVIVPSTSEKLNGRGVDSWQTGSMSSAST